MEVIVLSEHDSDNSVVEVEIPKKASPPIVQIDEDDILINVIKNQKEKETMEHRSNFVDPTPDVIPLDNPNNNFKEPEPRNPRIDISRMISPMHWTSDMIKFYNEDWGNERNFSVQHLQREMDQRPYLWQISHRDWMVLSQPKKPFTYCRNCHQPGHTIGLCNERKRSPKCHMCGIVGHNSNDCPNAICLSCGNKTRNYHVGCTRCALRNGRICSRCSMRGHCLVECPDHWRLYHLTLTTNDIVVPNGSVYKKEADIWCCNCGKRGHHQCHCNEPKNNDGFGLTVPYVMSYEREFYNQFQSQDNIDKKLTNKEQKKIKKAARLLNLKQLSKPRDLSMPKKKLSQKAIEKFKNREFKYGKAWIKKKKKKKGKMKAEKQTVLGLSGA